MQKQLFSIILLALLVSCSTTEKASPPNILVIMVDDLGYSDLSIYGSKDIKTPKIDSLMKQGTRFSDFTANCCVCSPSRAAFLTGRNQDMVGVPGVVRTNDDNNWGYMTPGVTTLPQIMKENGYRTSLVGKWHLGLKSPNTPNEKGFEEFHGFLGDMMDDYWHHRRRGNNYMYHNDELLKTEGTHATDLFTDWSIEELRKAKKDSRPFFQFLAYNAPHSPIHPPKNWLNKFQKENPKSSEKRAKIGALIEHLDYSIGRVLKSLKDLDLDKNTLVIFTSDNGGKIHFGATNGPFRSDKTHVYEGGLKVCTSFTWPGKIEAGKVTDFEAMTMDLFPTILEAAGIKNDTKIDGLSILEEVVKQNQKPFAERNQIYTWLQGYKKHALRKGEWKLVKDDEKSSYELYHLKEDPYETKDLATVNTKKFKELLTIMTNHLKEADKVNWRRPSQVK
ncbi:MAG: sulfatase-like hydrolase/transferase [Lentisphaeraceae bacterium]|nr:sulfatase-like hydrolase/transferase [Lentisphaeraceae bacterium]